MGKFIRSKPGEIVSPQPNSRLAEYPMQATHPALWEYLTLDQWEEGEPRTTSTLSVFFGSNGLQAALNDRDGGRVAFVTALTVVELLEALEHGLQSDSLDWRVSFIAKGKQKKK